MYPVTPESTPRGVVEIEKTLLLTPGDPLTVANVARLSLGAYEFDDATIRGGFALKRKPASASSKSRASTKSKRNPAPRKPIHDDFIRIDDWDYYGNVPKLLLEYEGAMSNIEGSKNWTDDQKKIHKLSFMRGHHPMIPSWWRLYYKMWGITQSELDDVFTPIDDPQRVVIHAYGNELAGKWQPPSDIHL